MVDFEPRGRRPRMRAASLWLVVFSTLCLLAITPGCKRRPTDELAQDNASQPTTLPPLAITDDTPDLLLTWVNARGDANTVGKPLDVPTEGRDQVRVVVTTKEEGTR